jgi:hypothetical protein
MRPVRILLIAVALFAVAVTGWALADGDGYRYGTAEATPAQTTQASAEPAAPVDPAPQDPESTTAPVPGPRIVGFGSEPVLPQEGGFWRLPSGAGTLTLITAAPNATKVEFLLTPTGTNAGDLAVRIGQDTNGRDGWWVNWNYRDEPLLAHLTVRATGPGGTAEEVVGIYHPDPAEQP